MAARSPAVSRDRRTIYKEEGFHGTYAARQGLGRPHGPDAAVRPDAAPDRPAPDPRGHDAAGLPDAQGAEAQGPDAGAHLRHARSHHPDRRPDPSLRRPRGGGDGRAHVPQHEGLRPAALRHVDGQAGHRPRHRPGAGSHAAGHDHRVRRQPYLHPRRRRRHRVRHRDHAGARRARHTVPWPSPSCARCAWRARWPGASTPRT
jgi:hypothetical protein